MSQRDRAAGGKGSLVIIILLMLRSSPDGHHLPPPQSPFPRTPVFISSLSATDLYYLFLYFASLGGGDKIGEEGER